MQHKEAKIIITAAAACILLLITAALCICGEVSAAEITGTEQLRIEAPASAHAGDTLQIPVTLKGYPRGINQYAIEIAAQAPGITAADLTVLIDKTMIQHTAASEPAASADKIVRRYIQTVKMAAFENYGVEETLIGTIALHLPESDSAYDAVISARILESTSGEPLENLAVPKTSCVIHTEPPAAAEPANETPHIPAGLIILIAAAAVLIAVGAVTLSRRNRR